jgi:hypothetical protein
LKAAKATADYIEEMKNGEKFMDNWDKALGDFEKKHKLPGIGGFESFIKSKSDIHLPSALEFGSSAAISAQAHFEAQGGPQDLQQQIRDYVSQMAQTEKDQLAISQQIYNEMQRQGVDIPN